MLSISWAWKESKPLKNFHGMPPACLMTSGWTGKFFRPSRCWSASPGPRANPRPQWRPTCEWPVRVRSLGSVTAPGLLSATPAAGTSTKAGAGSPTTTLSWKRRWRAAVLPQTTTQWSYIPPHPSKVARTALFLQPHVYVCPKTSFCQY